MHGDRCDNLKDILPLKDAVVLAQPQYWDNFPPHLLDHRVTIAASLKDLTEAAPDQNLAIIVLDGGDIHNHVIQAWDKESVRELVIVLPDANSHDVHLRNLARIDELSDQLESFVRHNDILAIRCVKDAHTDWDIAKLLDVIETVSETKTKRGVLDVDPALNTELVSHLTTLEQLIDLIRAKNSVLSGWESPDLVSITEENTRLKSNNASLRIQVEALQRKYNTLANSRLGKLTLKRWGRK